MITPVPRRLEVLRKPLSGDPRHPVSGVGTLPLQTGQSDGFRVLGSVGYGLGNGLRLEVEGDFLRTAAR